MSLSDITLWFDYPRIRQLGWPEGTYFEPVSSYYPEYVDGWMTWENGKKRGPYSYCFGGKSLWEKV